MLSVPIRFRDGLNYTFMIAQRMCHSIIQASGIFANESGESQIEFSSKSKIYQEKNQEHNLKGVLHEVSTPFIGMTAFVKMTLISKKLG